MTLKDIIGNKDAVTALEGMIRDGRVPHAMMLYENDGCGAMALTLAFLSDLFDSERKVSGLMHPDVHYVYPVASGTKVNEKVEKLRAELFLGYWRDLIKTNPYALESEINDAFGVAGKQTSINNAEAKEILETIYLTPVEGGWKAVVVYLPEKMNAAAANRLLKAVEEPPEKTVFMMITHAPEKVLQTISSRCQALRVHPLSKSEVAEVLESKFEKEEGDAVAAAQVAGGSIGEALRYLSGKEDYEEQMSIFSGLMEALGSKDLNSALNYAEALAGLGSREKQKAFCKFAAENLRKVFLLQQKLPQIAGLAPGEESFLASVATKCKKSFPRQAVSCLDRAALLIDRNVLQRIVFCDLVCRLYSIF
jgi:DNA polymerase-3 subunit delta'